MLVLTSVTDIVIGISNECDYIFVNANQVLHHYQMEVERDSCSFTRSATRLARPQSHATRTSLHLASPLLLLAERVAHSFTRSAVRPVARPQSRATRTAALVAAPRLPSPPTR